MFFGIKLRLLPSRIVRLSAAGAFILGSFFGLADKTVRTILLASMSSSFKAKSGKLTAVMPAQTPFSNAHLMRDWNSPKAGELVAVYSNCGAMSGLR